MATTVTVTYEDGRTDEVALRAVDMVKAERHFKGVLPSIEGTLFAAWKRLKPGESFENWLDVVDKMDVQTEEDSPLAEGPSPAP